MNHFAVSEVLFDSGVYLIPVDPDDLPEATATQLEDPKETGKQYMYSISI